MFYNFFTVRPQCVQVSGWLYTVRQRSDSQLTSCCCKGHSESHPGSASSKFPATIAPSSPPPPPAQSSGPREGKALISNLLPGSCRYRWLQTPSGVCPDMIIAPWGGWGGDRGCFPPPGGGWVWTGECSAPSGGPVRPGDHVQAFEQAAKKKIVRKLNRTVNFRFKNRKFHIICQ